MIRPHMLLHALAATAVLGAAAGCSRSAPPPNLVLISIDTCRADHLSAYGYERETSPFLEELAASGVLFENAFCQVPDTTPSHASLFTATYPDVHQSANGVPLGPGLPTLAETLRGAGYRTAGFVSGLTMTARRSGLGRGFELYDDTMTQVGNAIRSDPHERPARETIDRALQWLQSEPREPFFLFVHLFDPHAIYMPPPPYDGMFPAHRPGDARRRLLRPEEIPTYARIGEETDLDLYLARYDGEIRYVDDQLRRLHEALRARGELDSTLFAVTADHGEDLGEHGEYFSHGRLLFDAGLHVPLILSYPARLPSGRRASELTETIDIAPTLLELLGVEAPRQMMGESLLPLLESGKPRAKRFLLARTTKTWTYLRLARERDLHDLHALRDERWKLIASDGGGPPLLFDLAADPGETRNVLDQDPKAGELLLRVLQTTVGRLQARAGSDQPAGSTAADEALLDELRALGYVR